MLCQTLLTALAVTCTLSCIHADGQSTQRLDHIKDLMCVLILSGIQKEDLDANMLQKLQRHNVNISEMNNEELRRKCKGLDINLVESNLTTTESYSSKDKINIKNDKSLYKTIGPGEVFQRKINLDTIADKLSDELESNNQKILTTQKVPSIIEQLNKESNSNIEYSDGSPKIESVLNFWDKFVKVNKRDSSAITPGSLNTFIGEKNNDGDEQKNKRDIRNDKNTNESYIINKMITNFLLQKKNLDTDRPSTQGFKIQNGYESNISPNDGYSKIYKEDLMVDKFNVGSTLEHLESKNFDKSEPRSLFADMETEEVSTYNPYKSFKDMLAEIDQKTAFPFLDLGSKNYHQYKNIEDETPKVSNDFYFDTLLKSKTVLPNKYPEKEPSQSFSHDVIQDIAESVKALVLKDLRNEVRIPNTTTTAILSTSQKYTVTTEKGTTHLISEKDNAVQESVLTKFMELFEQIKSLKNNPVVITRDKSPTENKEYKDGFNKVNKKLSIPNNRDETLVPKTSLHNTIKQTYVNTPIFKPLSNINFGSIYDFGPQIHKFRSSPVVVTEKTSVKSYVSNKKPVPITFQTNALEIPPLGVYLDKPHDPINQNIIVTTYAPQRIGHKERYTAYSSAVVRNNKANLNKPNAFGSQPNTYCSTHDCTRLKKVKSRNSFKSSNNDESNFAHHNNNLNRYITYTDPVHIEKQINVPRYYERLENMDEEITKKKIYIDCCEEKYMTSQQASDCCNRKIASRQQISLNPLKRGYDDIHFKNFLKSQQKVTDMLERILAVKNKLRSVESI